MSKQASLVLVCLAGAVVSLGQAQPRTQGGALAHSDGGVRGDVRRILLDEWLRARTPQREVEEALVGLGRPAIPVLFQLLAGEDEEFFAGAEGFELFRGRTAEGMLETCTSVLAALPEREVVAHLERRLDSSASMDLRWAAIDVLGELGNADGLPLLFEVAGSFGNAQRRVGHVARRLRDGLLGILSADRDAWDLLIEAVRGDGGEAHVAWVVEALEASDSGRILHTGAQLLGRDPEFDTRLVRLLGERGEARPWQVDDVVLAGVRARLGAKEVVQREAAAVAVGRLHDLRSFERLQRLLKDPSARVRRSAQWSLERLAGVKRGSEPQAWAILQRTEQTFREERGELLLDALEQGNPAQALTAARELAAHPLYRDEMAPALVGLIAAHPRLSAQLFPMVERLAARASIPALVDLLFAPDEAVKEQAWRLLKRFTGETLPRDKRRWDDWLDA